MKTKTTQFCAIVVSMALLDAGYAAPGSFDLPTDADGAPILLATNLVFQRTIQTQTSFIQHEATERQRKIAQAHALAFMKHLEVERKAVARTEKKPTTTTDKKTATTEKKPPTKTATKTTAKTPRYIAVDTEKNAQTSPKAKKVVMVWDTQSESLVGNTVYDLPDPPAVGGSIVFTTYAAEYVGGNN
jgi:hypothetical protein